MSKMLLDLYNGLKGIVSYLSPLLWSEAIIAGGPSLLILLLTGAWEYVPTVFVTFSFFGIITGLAILNAIRKSDKSSRERMRVRQEMQDVIWVNENKEYIMKKAKEKGKEKEIKSYIQEFERLYYQYGISLVKTGSTAQMYTDSLKTIKINPYTAGGIASGIAGTGAGIYAAHNAAKRNSQIDQNRRIYSEKLMKEEAMQSSTKAYLLQFAKTIRAEIEE